MKELVLRRRTKLRSKDAKKIFAWMEEEWGIVTDTGTNMDTGSLGHRSAYLINGKIIGVEEDGGFMLTLHGILELSPTKKYVTVDMGAVRFLANGADVMAPGVLEADEAIEKDDLVFTRDVNNKRPLCVGRALISGPEMVRATSGKAIKTLHFVGDEVWNAGM